MCSDQFGTPSQNLVYIVYNIFLSGTGRSGTSVNGEKLQSFTCDGIIFSFSWITVYTFGIALVICCNGANIILFIY